MESGNGALLCGCESFRSDHRARDSLMTQLAGRPVRETALPQVIPFPLLNYLDISTS